MLGNQVCAPVELPANSRHLDTYLANLTLTDKSLICLLTLSGLSKLFFTPSIVLTSAALVAPVMSLGPLRETDQNYRSNPLVDYLHPDRAPRRSAYPLFEQAFYGSAERARSFDRDLRQSYRSVRTSDIIYLGKADRKAPAALLATLTRAPRVETFPGGHDVVTGLAVVWDSIAADIAAVRTKSASPEPVERGP